MLVTMSHKLVLKVMIKLIYILDDCGGEILGEVDQYIDGRLAKGSLHRER